MKHIFKTSSLILILFSFTVFTSCIVSKKKYEAIQQQRKKSIDSLENILDNTVKDFNQHTYELTENNKKRITQLDSLNQEVNRLTSDTTDLKQSLRDAISEYNKEKESLKSKEMELKTKSAVVDSLKLVLEEKQKRLIELENMISENKKEVNKLKKTISDALVSFDNTELNITQKNGKVYVAMEEKLLFKSGSATVDKKGVDALKKIAAVLEKTNDIDIVIEGHTDNVGSAKLNWELSTKRANAIVTILQENSNVDPKRFTAAGRGMYHPVAKNDTKEGKAKNRRIEIILTPKLDQLYKMLEE